LRISWAKHKTNEWILEPQKVKKELLGRVKSLKTGYYGDVVRKHNSIEKEVIQGCTSDRRK